MLDQNTDRMWFVIGAVIVGAAIIFIANGTLPDVFASVGDTMSSSIDDFGMFVQMMGSDRTLTLIDDDFSGPLDTSRYVPRNPTKIEVVDVDGSQALAVNFISGHNGVRAGANDLTIRYTMAETRSVREGDTFEVTFKAKANDKVTLGSRVGGLFSSEHMKANLNDTWQTVSFRMPVSYFYNNPDKVNVPVSVILWTEDPSLVHIKDMKIQIYVND